MKKSAARKTKAKPAARAGTAALRVRKGIRPIRRIVTGHDAKGRSIIASDRASPHTLAVKPVNGIPTFGVTDFWKTFSAPADNTSKEDPGGWEMGTLAPPPKGSILRVVAFPPDKVWRKSVEGKDAFAGLGKSGTAAVAAAQSSSGRHQMMHRTKSVDYAIVLSGEIYAVMDVGETKMKAGDILIQRGTNHSWANRSNKTCEVCFVLIDANPIPGLDAH